MCINASMKRRTNTGGVKEAPGPEKVNKGTVKSRFLNPVPVLSPAGRIPDDFRRHGVCARLLSYCEINSSSFLYKLSSVWDACDSIFTFSSYSLPPKAHRISYENMSPSQVSGSRRFANRAMVRLVHSSHYYYIRKNTHAKK